MLDATTYNNTVSNSIDDLFQSVQALNCAINLAARVIADHDGIAAYFDCTSGICNALDTLQEEWSSAGDALPFFHEPFSLLPGMGMTMPTSCKSYAICLDVSGAKRTICSHPSTLLRLSLASSEGQCSLREAASGTLGHSMQYLQHRAHGNTRSFPCGYRGGAKPAATYQWSTCTR